MTKQEIKQEYILRVINKDGDIHNFLEDAVIVYLFKLLLPKLFEDIYSKIRGYCCFYININGDKDSIEVRYTIDKKGRIHITDVYSFYLLGGSCGTFEGYINKLINKYGDEIIYDWLPQECKDKIEKTYIEHGWIK